MICLHLICESWWDFWVTVLVTPKPHLRSGFGRDTMETAGANTLWQLHLLSFLSYFLLPLLFHLTFQSSLGPSKKPLVSPFNVTLKLTKVSYRLWEAESRNQQLSLSNFCVLILQLSCHCHLYTKKLAFKLSSALLSNIHVCLFLARPLYLCQPAGI